MTERRYDTVYLEQALNEIPDFEAACRVLGLDPRAPADAARLVSALSSIGEFGAVRLAHEFPDITDEEPFRLVTETALRFYWLVSDFWDERRRREEMRREREEAARRAELERRGEELAAACRREDERLRREARRRVEESLASAGSAPARASARSGS